MTMTAEELRQWQIEQFGAPLPVDAAPVTFEPITFDELEEETSAKSRRKSTASVVLRTRRPSAVPAVVMVTPHVLREANDAC